MTVMALALTSATASAQAPAAAARTAAAGVNEAKLGDYKKEAVKGVDELGKMAQEMVDSVFSFGELGMQEVETSKYLTAQLEKFGFKVTRGQSGIPTAWVATWGSGKPVIALGSDIDGIPQASQKPGVAYRDPLIAGAPGHGEGHNSGMPLNVAAALAVKQIMEREKLPGTLMLWPGVAEELLATKAWYVREGIFKDVDVCLFAHVGNNLGTSWGQGGGTGLISVEYNFTGETAHSAGAPWRGRSALDAVELMNSAWNFRREHLRLQQRSHYVVTNGGDQPNVVPRNASVWYYFRETTYEGIKNMWEVGDKMAEGASMMTNTKWSSKVLGSAWPSHMNRTLAETMHANIAAVGLPQWSDADVQLAKATQRELGVPESGLSTRIAEQVRGRESQPDEDKRGGGSDDIGDISWTVPTVSLSFPANFQAGPGHNWANAIAMATPIAHKGTVAGARVQAMTLLDLLTRADVLAQSREYFEKVQTRNHKYTPLIRPQDQPAVHLNKAIMDRYRPEMRKFYYDATKHKTYLDQLGIKYPTVRTGATTTQPPK